MKQGWPALHERLSKVDEPAAKRIHPHDSQRIQRALEVFELTGKNLTMLQKEKKNPLIDYEIINLAIAPKDRAILHDRIAERFSAMLEEGFISEVEKLFARGDLNLQTPAIRSVGYRQVWEYLEGGLTFDEMREKAIIATRQLAKRQLTWLRAWPTITWLDSEEKNLFFQIAGHLKAILF